MSVRGQRFLTFIKNTIETNTTTGTNTVGANIIVTIVELRVLDMQQRKMHIEQVELLLIFRKRGL